MAFTLVTTIPLNPIEFLFLLCHHFFFIGKENSLSHDKKSTQCINYEHNEKQELKEPAVDDNFRIQLSISKRKITAGKIFHRTPAPKYGFDFINNFLFVPNDLFNQHLIPPSLQNSNHRDPQYNYNISLCLTNSYFLFFNMVYILAEL